MLHALRGDAVEHLRPPRPIHFPEFELVAEGKRHLTLRTFLYQLLLHKLGAGHSVGSDQFVYWNARDPKRKLAPDVFVCLDVPNESFGSWKTWERRVPELGIEIVSPSEDAGDDWEDKLGRYHELGIRELVRFDPEAEVGARLRIWDRIDHDLVERRVAADATTCLTLGLTWVVREVDGEPVGLRLTDEAGGLVLNALESANARIRELEAELAKRPR